MAADMEAYGKMMAEKRRRNAERNQRLEEQRKKVAEKAWEEMEMEQQKAAEYLKALVDSTASCLSAIQDTQKFQERLARAANEKAALRREVDNLLGELGDARAKIGMLEAELARTRLEEEDEMEEE
jgi:hypothetical protein